MASGGIGRLAIRLISLPVNVASVLQDAVTQAELIQITGSKRLPNSVYGLQPNNPTFKVLNSVPMTVPYHSIIGDRGKGDSPNSTDGVVPYWSSHLDGHNLRSSFPVHMGPPSCRKRSPSSTEYYVYMWASIDAAKPAVAQANH